MSVRYTKRLAEAEIDLSVGTVGDAYDNAYDQARGRHWFKTTGAGPGHMRHRPLQDRGLNQIGPWKAMREVEWETPRWADWHNNRRLPGPIGYIPPAKAKEACLKQP